MKTPRLFSRPVLLLSVIPEKYRDLARLAAMTGLSFPARVWKILFEAHQGYDWMVRLDSKNSPPPL